MFEVADLDRPTEADLFHVASSEAHLSADISCHILVEANMYRARKISRQRDEDQTL
jgi:hypothetical protein